MTLKRWCIRARVKGFIASGIVVLLLAGCESRPLTFDSNRLVATILEQESGLSLDVASKDVQLILDEVFGTPDEPRFPAYEGSEVGESLVKLDNLKRAAGRVYSTEDDTQFGLYRKNCVTCHGVEGDGRGAAAALQTPYPRDFTAGIFKYKSTPRGKKPTREDLRRTLVRGLPGTGMPAFNLLAEADVEALLDYVIYLSVRGEVERELLRITANEMDYAEADGEKWLPPRAWTESVDSVSIADIDGKNDERVDATRQLAAEQQSRVTGVVNDVVSQWIQAPQQVTVIADPEWAGSEVTGGAEGRLLAGKELFHGQVANCASCHGVEGAGLDKLLPDYDDWTKEWTTKMGIDPVDREKTALYRKAGALRPRVIVTRNLTNGVFRGGDEPLDIFRRIVHGIDGTSMPAVNWVEDASESGLTTEQVWQLVEYVESLGDQVDRSPVETIPGPTNEGKP